MTEPAIDNYRQQSYEIWEAMAKGWLRERAYMWDTTRAVGEAMVERLDPKPGHTVLELAAGVGDTGFAAAARMGDSGRLISTDFSPQMVEAARERARELGLKNVVHRVMDAESIDLESGSMNGVLCRWGYMLMGNTANALAESRRVLRADGRLCFSVWADVARNPWGALAGATLVQLGHMPAPEPGAPGIFAMGDPARIRELVRTAGFGEPQIEEIEVAFRFSDFEEYWRFLTELAGGIAMVLEALSDEDTQEVRGLLEERTAPFASPEGLSMPGVSLNVVAG